MESNKSNLLIFLSIFFVVFFTRCESQKKSSDQEDVVVTTPVAENGSLSEGGYKLLQRNCLICHTDQDLPHDRLIAPPMAAVKRRYTEVTATKEEFINRMTEFTLSPTIDEAVMYGAVRNFNLMLPVPIDESTMRIIADFIYENDIEAPGWFAEHYEEMHPEDQAPMPLELEEKIQAINDEVRSALGKSGNSKINLVVQQQLESLLETVNNQAEQESTEAYHRLAADLKSRLPESERTENNFFQVYLKGLNNKLDLLESANSKVEAEFVLLHIRKQLQMLSEYFSV